MVHGGSSIVKYILQTADGTVCAQCNNREVYLLCPEDMAFTLPAFYICLKCHFIGQIGVGEVPYESKFDKTVEKEDDSG